MKYLTKLIIFVLSISYSLTGAGDLDDDWNAECTSDDVCKCKSGYYKKILLVLQILL